MSFPKNMVKNVSRKYGQKLLDSAKKSTADAIETSSERVIQKTAKATGYLVCNKITDKITRVSKKSLTHSQNNEANDGSEASKEKYISPEKRQQIIDELRLL